MDNAPRVRFVSSTFVVGFGIGAFIGVVLALVAVAMALPEREATHIVEVPVLAVDTPESQSTPPPSVRVKAALTVRVGPGESFATLGTLSRGDSVDVIGRDFDSTWVAIRFPLGSSSRGWVSAADVEGLTDSNLQSLAVLLPTPIPLVFNTPSAISRGPAVIEDDGPGSGPRATAGPRTTAGPRPTTSDLDIASVRVLADGRVSVTILNRGPADLRDTLIIVLVRSLGLSGEALSFAGTLESGASAVLRTEGFRVTAPMEIQVVVDPSASINDPVRANNVETSLLSPPAPPPIPTPTPEGFG